jgi:hypothetical protein
MLILITKVKTRKGVLSKCQVRGRLKIALRLHKSYFQNVIRQIVRLPNCFISTSLPPLDSPPQVLGDSQIG